MEIGPISRIGFQFFIFFIEYRKNGIFNIGVSPLVSFKIFKLMPKIDFMRRFDFITRDMTFEAEAQLEARLQVPITKFFSFYLAIGLGTNLQLGGFTYKINDWFDDMKNNFGSIFFDDSCKKSLFTIGLKVGLFIILLKLFICRYIFAILKFVFTFVFFVISTTFKMTFLFLTVPFKTVTSAYSFL